MGYNSIASIFICFRCFAKSAKSSKIPREFELTVGQGHPRSSVFVSIESA